MTALDVEALPGAPPFTAEQRGAVADRDGSRLLSANAGSGKTAVMVERFVEAAVLDERPVASILAITFTEKAAGELRERIRARLLALGDGERARAVDGAWIGTIHGFCARVLRSQPLAAGLDPRFDVLDARAAERLAGAAFERAFEAWAARGGDGALDVAAAYGAALRPLVLGTHAELRSRGQSCPRLPAPPAVGVPDPAPLAAACEEAARLLAAAGDGRRVAEGLAAVAACAAVLRRAEREGRVPVPAELAAGSLARGAGALSEEGCCGYREAWEAYRQACADHYAVPALRRLDELLGRFGEEYARGKAGRAAVDFADLELRTRDLLAGDGAARRRWRERFALIMVDEFQDTNRVQLELLELLEDDNLFAVGDEFQSIYGFRHADVAIFRERRAALGPAGTRRLRTNFRAGEELLDVLNAAFAPVLGEDFAPLAAGRAGGAAPRAAADDGELRLFDPDDADPGEPPVEVLVTDTCGWDEHEERLGLGAIALQTWRRAEARLVAQRVRAEIDAGRRAGDIVVLVRAAASLRLHEQALDDQGVRTYVVGGRGYWTHEQVRDGLAWLRALANPRDEESLYGVLASPFFGASSDALVLLAEAARERGGGAWAALRCGGAWMDSMAPAEAERLRAFAALFEAERAQVERLGVEALLERAISTTGYDVAVLARPGGERRLANLRKLMRLSRDYERAEGRDVHGFVAYAAMQDLRVADEGEAALEAEGIDAVRLMTIHRAKGLQFPVVCVADLGRPPATGRPALLVGADGRIGLRLNTPGGGGPVAALDYEALVAEREAAEAEEERRLLYVALTRAQDKLIVSGGIDCERLHRDPAARGALGGRAPFGWLLPALVPDAADAVARVDGVVERRWQDRPARLRVRVSRPSTLGRVLSEAALAPSLRAGGAQTSSALPPAPKVVPEPGRTQPGQLRLSYSQLQAYAKCPYRFYLQRVLRLPDERLRPDELAALAAAAAAQPAAASDAAAPPEAAPLDMRLRGTIIHLALEQLDARTPVVPELEQLRAIAQGAGAEPTDEELADMRALVAAFAGSELRARLAAAPQVRREAGFAFSLAPGGALVSGFVDVLAREADGRALVVDYKSDRLDGLDPRELADRDYAVQRLVYALAALNEGAPSVEVAHCFLERPDEPATVTYAASEAPALAEQLVELARGIIDERWPVTDAPHRDLCGDCPGRRALCSHPPELTLRDHP